jgi:hypothetical protein
VEASHPILCQRGLKELETKTEIKLATQPCPNDKWGKQMNEILQKLND